jgi:ribosomal protein S18 acetylase RimI-like enzyme
LNIRTATPADLDAVCGLADEIASLHNQREPEWFAPADVQRDRAFWLASIVQGEGTVLVAEQEGTLVGFISARIVSTVAASFLTQRITCRIGSIAVAPSHRRAGIGTRLIRAAEAWAVSRSAVDVRLEVFAFNAAALEFYAALGYGPLAHIMHRAMP